MLAARLPASGEAEQPQQVPELDRVHLHRRGREQQQRSAPGPELLHQAEELVGPAFSRRSRRFPAGVMGLVQDEQVPVLSLKEVIGAVGSTHELAGGEDERLLVPLLPVDLALGRALPAVGPLPDELLAVVDRHVEVELFVELALPLGQQRPGHEDENAPRPSRQPRLADEKTRRDRLAETHLIGDEHLAGPGFDEPQVGPHLMGPGGDRRRHLAHTGTVPGPSGVPDVRPDDPALFVGEQEMGGRNDRGWLRFRILDLGKSWRGDEPVVPGQELEELGFASLRKVEDPDAPRLPVPELPEGFDLVLDMLEVASPLPREVNVKALPVADPAGPSLIDAATEREAVPLAVGEDSHLLVVDAPEHDRLALGVGGYRDLDVETSVRDHPGECFQAVPIARVGRRQIDRSQLLGNQLTKVVAPIDGFDLIHIQGAADDEPHLTAIRDQPFNAPGCQDQGIRREVAGRPVILHGARQDRDVKQANEVPILMAVAGLPGMSR